MATGCLIGEHCITTVRSTFINIYNHFIVFSLSFINVLWLANLIGHWEHVHKKKNVRNKEKYSKVHTQMQALSQVDLLMSLLFVCLFVCFFLKGFTKLQDTLKTKTS